MAIDYNKLMEELDSCLGLESSATKSVKRPSGPSKKRKAFEGYDDVDLEIIQAMKDSPEGAPPEFSEEDLVYSEDGLGGDQDMPRVEEDEGDNEESPEIKLADSVDCLFNNYIESGKTPQEAADSIKDLVESAVAELYEPDDDDEVEADEGMEDVVTPVKEVSCHSLANRSSTESLISKSRLQEIYEDFFDEAELGISPSLGEIIKYAKDYLKRQSPEDLKKDFGEYADPVRLAKKMLEMDKIDNGPDGKPISKARLEEICEDFWDGSGLGVNPPLEETIQYAKDYLEVWSPNKLKRDFGPYADPELLAKKMLEMDKMINESTNRSAEENSKTMDDDPYDPDAAFEALSSKMLNRYSQLTRRNQPKSKKSAEEGVSATEVKIDDNAIRRVSCEFAYSGKNLRKMVAEAIKKGVI